MNQASSVRRWPTVVAVSLGWLFSAVDIVLLILFQKELAHSLGVDIQAIRVAIGIGLFGSAVGGLCFSQIGDRLGRVKALSLSIILYSVATGAMSLTSSLTTLYALRFMAGVGTGAEWSIGFALLSEVWSPKSRGAVGGLVAGMFNFGTFLAIALFQSPLGWRWSFGVMVAPALLAVGLRRYIPESPVWLKLAEERKNGQVSPALEAELKRAPAMAAFSGESRWRTLHMTLIFAIMNVGFYSFSTIFIDFLSAEVSAGGLSLEKSAQLPFHLTLNLASLVSIILAGWLSDYIGRKRSSYLFCFAGGAGFLWLNHQLSQTAILEASDPNYSAILLLPFALCCVGFGINGVMGIFAPELFPTYLRSTGPGVSQNIGKGIGGLLGPPLAGKLVLTHGYAFVLSLPGWVFAALCLLIWRLPEVAGRLLKHDEA